MKQLVQNRTNGVWGEGVDRNDLLPFYDLKTAHIMRIYAR